MTHTRESILASIDALPVDDTRLFCDAFHLAYYNESGMVRYLVRRSNGLYLCDLSTFETTQVTPADVAVKLVADGYTFPSIHR